MIGEPTVLTDLASVEGILPEWRALTAGHGRSALDAADWLMPLARQYLRDYSTRFLTWRHEGELVAVAPFSLVHDRPRWRPISRLALWGTIGPRMRGMVDVVARAELREEVLDSLCTWLRTNREWEVLVIDRPQVGSSTPARIKREADTARWTYAPFSNVRSRTYQIELPASLEEWANVLLPLTRKNLRYQERKFAEFRGGRFEPVIVDESIPDALDALERLLTARWGPTEVYFRNEPNFRELLKEAIPAMAKTGSAWLSVARDDLGIHACLVNIAQNGYAMSLLVAATADRDYRKFSLGAHVFDAGYAEAIRRQCHTYDLLWVGDYKQSFWHATPRLLESAIVGRGVVGRNVARIWARREDGPVEAADGAVSAVTAESTK